MAPALQIQIAQIRAGEKTRVFRPRSGRASIGRRLRGLPECAADWGRSDLALRAPDEMRRQAALALVAEKGAGRGPPGAGLAAEKAEMSRAPATEPLRGGVRFTSR